MRVSQKTEYALRAMLELAKRADQPDPVRTADIARKQRIPEKFLEMILVELRRSRLIDSKRGMMGGHRLSREAQAITVGDIWRAIEDDALEVGNDQTSQKSIAAKPFDFVWRQVNLAVTEIVDGVTLEEIRLRAESGQNVQDFAI